MDRIITEGPPDFKLFTGIFFYSGLSGEALKCCLVLLPFTQFSSCSMHRRAFMK